MEESKKKGIAILGSTGSIGTQALDVIKKNTDLFFVSVLTANENADLLIKQAKEFKPNTVVIGNEEKFNKVKGSLSDYDIKVFTTNEAIEQVIDFEENDIILNSLLGFAGLKPTIKAINSGKILALANKESLVIAGEIINKSYKGSQASIIPVDSEHSAIYQCLIGEFNNPIEKIMLTASGGPFYGKDSKHLEKVTKADALKHPKWNMGNKITIDSATMMNKGFEIIEAKWLFDLRIDQIEVLVHPQSLVHSFVQFTDGSIKAQLGMPDMRIPIQYAFSFPKRIKSDFPRLDFLKYPNLTFDSPDFDTFPNLRLAYQVIEKAGNMPCILNAGNEIAVEAFLSEKAGFQDIYRINKKCLETIDYMKNPSLDDYFKIDAETRKFAKTLIK